MLIPEYVEILAELGLTRTEAKVYIALLRLKSANAHNIHKESNVARQEVYRVLSDLEEKGLIERVIAKPVKFRAIQPNDAISILLQRRNERTSQLQEKAINTFRNFEIDCIGVLSLSRDDAQFVLLSSSETNPTTHTDRLTKAVANAQTSVMGLMPFQLFMKLKYTDEQIWKKAVKRGVKFKIIIGGVSEKRKTKLGLDPALRNTDNFKVRLISALPSSCLLLVDDDEAFCRIGRDLKSPVLLSLAPSYTAMMKDYFETKWQSLENREGTC